MSTEHQTPHSRSRRRQETDLKILRAVLRIATTQGLGAVTIEEVARTSGVAKTTIYRRYENTDDMLESVSRLEAFAMPSMDELPSPSKASLMEVFTRMEQAFVYSIGVRTVGMVISSRNDFFRNILHHGVLPVLHRLGDYFRLGIKQGAFKASLDIETLITMIVGSLITHHALAEGVLNYPLTPQRAQYLDVDDFTDTVEFGHRLDTSDAGGNADEDDDNQDTMLTQVLNHTQYCGENFEPTEWAKRITEQLWPAICA